MPAINLTPTFLLWAVVLPALAYAAYLTWPPPTTRARVQLAFVRWLDTWDARHRVQANATPTELYAAVRTVLAKWWRNGPATLDPLHDISTEVTDAVLAVLTRRR